MTTRKALSEAARVLGRKGGEARAKALSHEQRQAISRLGGLAAAANKAVDAKTEKV